MSLDALEMLEVGHASESEFDSIEIGLVIGGSWLA